MPASEELLRNNEEYARAFEKSGVPAAPAKRVAVVACMDARMDVHKILGLDEGDAHVIRNAGGVATEDVIRSLVVSQLLLGTEEIILIHHTRCGMMTVSEDDLNQRVREEVGVEPPFSFETFEDLDENVRLTAARLEESPFILKKSVRGFVYDVETGRLREVALKSS